MFEHAREPKPSPAADTMPQPVRRAPARSVHRATPEVGAAGGPVSPELAGQIRSSGAGQPLPDPVRTPMERAFGADLSAVRIHPRSDAAPRLAASAFTVGQDIHFAPGEYRPDTASGRLTLAHELAHTVQAAQGASIRRKVGFEYEFGDFNTQAWGPRSGWVPHAKGALIKQKPGYQVTADEATGGGSRLEIIVKEIDETDATQVGNLTGVTLPAIEALLDQLVQVAGPQVGSWVTTDQFPLLGGSTWHRLRAVQPAAADGGGISGQLQLTAGLSMGKLADFVSGQQATNFGPNAADANRFDEVMGRYQPVLGGGGVWGFAQAQVNGNIAFNALLPAQRNQLAALVALMANVPINVRTANNIEYPKATAGGLLARTDFSKIALSLPDNVKRALTPALLETLLVGTINQVPAIGGAVAAGDDVFPAGVGFIPTVPNLSGLTIGSWARSVVPTEGEWWGWWQGTDQLTKANFPGPHKGQMESMGAMGSKVDPGAKPIFEFRSLNIVFGDELVNVITDLLAYLTHP